MQGKQLTKCKSEDNYLETWLAKVHVAKLSNYICLHMSNYIFYLTVGDRKLQKKVERNDNVHDLIMFKKRNKGEF